MRILFKKEKVLQELTTFIQFYQLIILYDFYTNNVTRWLQKKERCLLLSISNNLKR